MILAVLLAALVLAAAIFALFPGLDLAVSHLFFDGATFPVESSPLVETLRQTFYWAEDIAGLAALPMAAWAYRAKAAILGQRARTWLLQGLIFLAGPVLLVNGILKPLWARPRPFRVADFGGDLAFQPIWRIQGLCPRNCSFSSGEMAGATALTVMAFMLARANRATLGRFYGIAVALAVLPMPFTFWQRVAAGRHFLSDVTFSALLVGLIAVGLSRALMAPQD